MNLLLLGICFNLGCFRPQQGLTIMNIFSAETARKLRQHRFRPQQGLTIMNMDRQRAY